jgi:DNA invertase Pin-like site-specific DNA recombinase
MSDLKPIEQIRLRRGTIPEKLKLQNKKHREIKKAIRNVLKGSENDHKTGKTIPEIAEETKISTHIINWHLASMRKYNTALESSERDGQYHKWVLIPKAKKKRET